MSDNLKINDQLNLVLPVRRADGRTFWVHSMPISAEVFANFYDPIARVFNKLYGGGIGIIAGPKIAYFALRDLCTQAGTWDGVNGIENTLCNEVWRLTNVLLPGANGWDMFPFSDVIRKNMMTAREIQEVKNILIFFIVNFSMHSPQVMRGIMMFSQNTWEARVTSLNCTEFKNSSEISTGGVNSGGTAAA